MYSVEPPVEDFEKDFIEPQKPQVTIGYSEDEKHTAEKNLFVVIVTQFNGI